MPGHARLARGTTTTYDPDSAGGLSTVTHSDTTPGVAYTYDRRARQSQVVAGAGITGPGERVFSFNVQGHEFKDFDVWVKAGRHEPDRESQLGSQRPS